MKHMTNKYMYFVANWKMFGGLNSLNSLYKVMKFFKNFKKNKFVNIIYCPPNTLIRPMSKRLKNSSIKVKNYLLDKNEKKLIKNSESIILTEKEVHLIDLLLNSPRPLSKDDILSSVWNYSAEADTHTVETHIYRLRKKINQKFMDEKFILNSKDGYHL